jgi:hypothetical protein
MPAIFVIELEVAIKVEMMYLMDVPCDGVCGALTLNIGEANNEPYQKKLCPRTTEVDTI